MPKSASIALLVFAGLVAGAGYLWSAHRQMSHVNLSATAGGQFPYIEYARGIVESGVTQHVGDRNRMPLIPTLLAWTCGEIDSLYPRGRWFAVISSIVLLAGIAVLAFAVLTRMGPSLLTLCTATVVFAPKASFVQAELAYYALFLTTVVLFCRLLLRPDWRWGIAAGLCAGLTFLTKSSVLPLIVAFLVIAAATAMARWYRIARPAREAAPADSVDRAAAGLEHRARPLIIAAAATLAVFLITIFPYIHTSKQRFGRYFYNVNSTFFMWCDNWPQANAFAQRFNVSEQFPDAPAELISSPSNYWQTHSIGQIVGRLRYGLATLAQLAWRSAYGKYLAVVLTVALVVAMRFRRSSWAVIRDAAPAVWLFVLMIGGYLIAYAWYVPIGYGDRFLLSLYLPVMLGALWILDHVALRDAAAPRPEHPEGGHQQSRTPIRTVLDRIWLIAAIALFIEGGIYAAYGSTQASDQFVLFYFNETVERVQHGDLDEAERGFEGILELRPEHAAAHNGLSNLHLRRGAFDDAIVHANRAIMRDPTLADAHNSLGSALAGKGDFRAAIEAFEKAVALRPDFASAWFNLGGCAAQLGDEKRLQQALRALRDVSPDMAQQLEAIVATSK